MTGRSSEPVLIRAAVACRAGKRSGNEDAFYLDGRCKTAREMDRPVLWQQESKDFALYAVCDGMGGMEHGETASFSAVDALRRLAPELTAARTEPVAALTGCMERMHWQVRAQSAALGCSIGSTAVLALVQHDRLTICNVGDSRAYLAADGALRCLSRDHTTAQALHDMGLPAPRRNTLTQYLGMDEDDLIPEPHCAEAAFPPGARLLLCSDGLTARLSEAEILAALVSAQSPLFAAEHLAQEDGGGDNLTALVAQWL